MPITTRLSLNDQLPLTCSRTGTCCHGKMVRLNPFELACLANTKGVTPREFYDRYCNSGGVILRFDGAPGWKKMTACSQYVNGFGCSVHQGRPLACRLYPLGRQKQGEKIYYMHEGKAFPCLEGCPEVVELPRLSVAEYIAGQQTQNFETAQDGYLEVMQSLADIAFAILLESGLAQSGDRQTLRSWRRMGQDTPEKLAAGLRIDWLNLLMLPEIAVDSQNPVSFIEQHNQLLQNKAQQAFETLDNTDALREASILMMGLALHLGRGLGAEPAELAEHWIKTAKQHGARD